MRILLLIAVFLTLVYIQPAKASALHGPDCFMKAKVVDISPDNSMVALRIIEIYEGKSCPVEKDQVSIWWEKYPAIFKKGDIIRMGVESTSTMLVNGPTSWLHWSFLSYDDGTFIVDKNNEKIEFASEPIRLVPANKEDKYF